MAQRRRPDAKIVEWISNSLTAAPVVPSQCASETTSEKRRTDDLSCYCLTRNGALRPTVDRLDVSSRRHIQMTRQYMVASSEITALVAAS
jgi:hypothetical protein